MLFFFEVMNRRTMNNFSKSVQNTVKAYERVIL